jgi:prolyl-tRNA editing enzyme YbaK/EbsC (Cys-tRNA(Pro) deacylase)
MADSAADKARKARNRAADNNYKFGSSSSKTKDLVMDLTRGKKASKLEKVAGGRIANAEEQRAAAIMQQRRKLDTGKVATRATAMAKRAAAEKKAKTLTTGVSGGMKAKAKPKTK